MQLPEDVKTLVGNFKNYLDVMTEGWDAEKAVKSISVVDFRCGDVYVMIGMIMDREENSFFINFESLNPVMIGDGIMTTPRTISRSVKAEEFDSEFILLEKWEAKEKCEKLFELYYSIKSWIKPIIIRHAIMEGNKFAYNVDSIDGSIDMEWTFYHWTQYSKKLRVTINNVDKYEIEVSYERCDNHTVTTLFQYDNGSFHRNVDSIRDPFTIEELNGLYDIIEDYIKENLNETQ